MFQTSAYDLKEAGETWRGISQPAACYPYDPTGMPTYPYSNAYVPALSEAWMDGWADGQMEEMIGYLLLTAFI